MFTTVCANPCIDRELQVNSFEIGETNRVIKKTDELSGKGINVARLLRGYDMETAATGFMPQGDFDWVKRELSDQGIITDFVPCAGELRVNLKVRDLKRRQITEINSSGPEVTAEQVQALLQKVREYAKKSEMLIMSGSMPPGSPKNLYADIVSDCRAHTRCVVDADGEALLLAVKQRPFMIKPNIHELENVTGRRLLTLPEIARAARALVDMGVEIVGVSMGGDGSMIVTERVCCSATAPKVPVGSTVAAGDTMVTAMCMSYLASESPETMLLNGAVAAGLTVSADKSIDAETVRQTIKISPVVY